MFLSSLFALVVTVVCFNSLSVITFIHHHHHSVNLHYMLHHYITVMMKTRRCHCSQCNLQIFITQLIPLEEKKEKWTEKQHFFPPPLNVELHSLISCVCLRSIEVTVSSKPQEEDTEGDVGLQLKVSFMDKAVQRNARLAGKWGPAENTLSFFPFAAGEAFKVRLYSLRQMGDTHSEFNKLLLHQQSNTQVMLNCID